MKKIRLLEDKLKEIDELNKKLDKEIEINVGGHKVKLQRYYFNMFLDEFCYYLKEEGIKGLGRENMMAGFLISEKSKNAINKFIESKIKDGK